VVRLGWVRRRYSLSRGGPLVTIFWNHMQRKWLEGWTGHLIRPPRLGWCDRQWYRSLDSLRMRVGRESRHVAAQRLWCCLECSASVAGRMRRPSSVAWCVRGSSGCRMGLVWCSPTRGRRSFSLVRWSLARFQRPGNCEKFPSCNGRPRRHRIGFRAVTQHRNPPVDSIRRA
jgi:hypothetical protein